MLYLICAIALLVVVAILGRSYKAAHVVHFDQKVKEYIKKIPDPIGLSLTVLSWLTRPLFLGFYAAVVFICLWLLGPHSQNMYLLGTIVGMASIEGAKQVIRRPRIDDPNVLKNGINSFSYPSGHAGSSLLFAMVISTLYPIAPLVVVLMVGAICVGISRIYIRVHYASDVLGGWLMAVAVYSLLLYFGLK
ncbi:MAG TPA: phosphatase PAP2 family protein [Candidatus Saccharimonadales bacterium]|nr:phosphatase PAP2 family protein [Candidatus Saccharimonadales bacterium]